ncbi:MAG: alpha-D-ribose 1-methylphosphonate 5-triphosphate synthase subunit PhnG [Candidatus Aldehydirespiratoraceae bacterium]|jgi:alpha-D-ribose 1-methylphosphonate 5-triphosphate synthase subunit PhnG
MVIFQTIPEQTTTGPAQIERRAELLAAADGIAVREVAERCLQRLGDPVIVTPPETGIVMMQVREPIVRERFHLGEVVVTRADVELGGHRGWSMRQGTDRVETLAAAICDAAARSGGESAADVERLCAETASHIDRREADLAARLRPTIVEFEELD